MLVNMNKKAHHNLFSLKSFQFHSTSLFSQHFRVCVYSVSVSRRCVRSARYSIVVKWICRLDWLQFRGWLGRGATLRGRCCFCYFCTDDFCAGLSKVVTQLQLNNIDAHRCESKSKNKINDGNHHVNWMLWNEITETCTYSWVSWKQKR